MTYNEFIQQIITVRGQWNDAIRQDYCERHHILPVCKGGLPKKLTWQHHENIIWLTASEHFIAHKLLALENPTDGQLVSAWSMMAFPKGKTVRNYEISAEDYETLRKLCSKQLSKDNPAIRATGHPWNYGLTKETDERLKKASENLIGINTWSKGCKRTDEQKQHYSDAVKQRYLEHPETFTGGNKNKIAITNGEVCKYINKDEPLPDGFTYGQGKHATYIIKDPEKFHELRSRITSGQNNGMFGNGAKISGGKNGHAIYIYTYKGIDYDCRDALMVELKKEFPDISESTIRKIMKNDYGKRIINKFQVVIDNLTWRLKCED